MKILCKFGIHKWADAGWALANLPDCLKQCSRCGAGLAVWSFGTAFTRYTAEQMEVWRNIEADNKAAQNTYLANREFGAQEEEAQ
jgi:hypothetical protein